MNFGGKPERKRPLIRTNRRCEDNNNNNNNNNNVKIIIKEILLARSNQRCRD
jgi:hypothetical protein